MTRRWTPEHLAATTLRRQFPRIRGRGPAAVVETYRRLGPIQTQVPRAAHLALASRLPGVPHAAITAAFEAYDVVKASNLRGTVHTSTREQHGWLAESADHARDLLIANHLRLDGLSPREVTDEIERYAAEDWRERSELVARMWEWLDSKGSGQANGATPSTLSDSLLWGHSRLVRRPRDTAWEKRTDVLHRTAAAVFDASRPSVDEAIEQLVRLHLGAYGPATRRDIGWWMGGPLTRIDRAIERLADELVRHPADGEPLVDLAEPPRGGSADPGIRLLPEFDNLIVGFAPANRNRFIDPELMDRIWGRENGLYRPAVLREGRIVASWKIITTGSRYDIEVVPLPDSGPVTADELAGPVAAVETALDIGVTDVRVLPPA